MGRDDCGVLRGDRCGFQFTRPAWGATLLIISLLSLYAWFQFTRPAWGATGRRERGQWVGWFQFTRPAWGATFRRSTPFLSLMFQFTRPAWGATIPIQHPAPVSYVSIHAPRMGRDLVGGPRDRRGLGFNSRAPHGARPPRACLSGRRERVSIHAPRMGRDRPQRDIHAMPQGFNSRAPHGARPRAVLPGWRAGVSIHAPRMGRDGGYCNTFSRNGKGE